MREREEGREGEIQTDQYRLLWLLRGEPGEGGYGGGGGKSVTGF